MELKNRHVTISFDSVKKQISAQDLRDMNNWPAMYSKGKRNVEKVWKTFEPTFTSETTFSDLTDHLSKNNIHYHYWCMMD